MIVRCIEWSIANRVLVLIATGFLCVASLVAMRHTPVDAIPDLSDVQVVVRTAWAGQSPEVVEQQLTYPLSTAMLAVPRASTVRGYSFVGDSYVYVLFEDGTDPYWARSRVLEALSQVSGALPAGVRPALGPDASGVGWVYEYALVDRSGRHDLDALTSLQNWFLKFELQALAGVAEVATVGGMVRQYQVVLDPDRLRAHDIALERVEMAIRRGNQESGGSVIEMAEAEYMVRADGYIDSLQDLGAIPLLTRPDGVSVRLRDVADLRLGPQMRRGVAELNGEGEVVGGIVVMRHGENARAVIERVRERLGELSAALPAGVEIVPTYDRSALIDRAIATLQRTLVEELLVVALICAAFLFHLRSALVALVSLPIGIGIAFLIMRGQGINANIMSLGGIAIAIGAMVDGAIVMVENLHAHLARPDGRDHWQRVRDAAAEVGPALFFSLLIITLSFLPVFALEAQEGRLFAPLAFTKTWAMAAAAGLAVTLVPVLMGYFIRGAVRSEAENPIMRRLTPAYRALLDAATRHPRATVTGGLLLAASGLYPAMQLGSEFMPPLDEGDWMYMPTTDPGIGIGAARALLQQTDRLIRSVPEVDTVFGKIGRAQTATDPAPLTMIETTITFKPRSEWRPGLTLEDIRAEIRQRVRVPGLADAWVMPIRTRIDMLATGIRTPVGIRVMGPDLDGIQDLARAVEKAVADLPGTVSAYAEQVGEGRYVEIEIDREAAGRLGLNIAEIHDVVRYAIGGMTVAETVEGRERYPINLRYPQATRNSPEALADLPVIAPGGAHLRLGDVADIRISPGPGMIRSENARLSATVYVDVEGRDLGHYVAEAKAAVAGSIDLPPGYSLQWAGQYEYLERAAKRMQLIVPATLALIAVLLFLAFGRGGPVLLVLACVPVALSGGVWLLHLLGYSMSVAVAVGFIALAGVAVEILVVMLTYIEQARRSDASVAPDRLVQQVATRRLRPVLMTAVATIGGLLPVMLASGTGSEVMHRIAAPMVGGMVTTVVLALFVLPAAYVLWARTGVDGR